MSKNYIALYEGLKIFRDAMLAFLAERLKMAYGDKWWEQGVRRVFREEDIAALETQFKRRFSSPIGPARPGTEQYEILDVNYFTNIFEGNWKQAFAEPFGNDRTVLTWLREVVALRNLVAHPETGDLSDDDTWRGLDTMERMLRVVDKQAANKVRQVKNRLRRSWVEAGYQPTRLTLGQVGISYEAGLDKLDRALEEQFGDKIRTGEPPDTYLDFQGHRRRLLKALEEEQRGIRDPQTTAEKERTLRALDTLALNFLGVSFTDLCFVDVPAIDITPQESSQKIQALESEIQNLEKKLVEKQLKRIFQQRTGETIPALEREIERLQSELDRKRRELSVLRETTQPPAYLSVRRKIGVSDLQTLVEEQFIPVSVEITNLGKEAAEVSYKEGLSANLQVVKGTLDVRTQIRPGETYVLSYTCYPVCPGRYELFTEYIDYEGKVSGWDQVEDTTIQVRAGTNPHLVATRFYRYIPDGIEVLIRLENKGDKIARSVNLHEIITVEEQPGHRYTLSFQGDIPGGQIRIAERKIPIPEPYTIRFPEKTEIGYKDSQGREYKCTLTAECKRIEYPFPSRPSLVGRETEIRVISNMIDNIWQASRGRYSPDLKRLLLIEGVEGAGKTRLVYEMLSIAENRGFRVLVEDAKDRSPVKRMLRRLLGLRPDEDDDVLIWKKIEEAVPGQHDLRRRQIFGLISTAPVAFDRPALDQLKADVLVFIKTLCQQGPTLLVFENVQWVPEGAEQELLSEILQSTLFNRELPLLFVVTYRPGYGKEGIPPVVSSLPPGNYFERLQLGPLGQESVQTLVNQLVDFPTLNQELHKFTFRWSHGNPFYLIELLRLLTKPATDYLVRVGDEWYPKHGLKSLEEAIPDSIEGVILERAKSEEELGGELELLRMLSAIGFELPLSLVKSLASQEFPEWSEQELLKRLHKLKKAGFLVESSEFEGYEFEHQIKREVLYQDEDFPLGERLRLRGKIAKILLDQKIFADPDEQLRQLARHLARASRDLQAAHIDVLVRAAEMEKGLRNFSRSLDYYNIVLDLIPSTFEAVSVLIERSRVFQLRGNWIPAQRDLEQAYALVAPESALAKQDSRRANRLRIKIEKEQGHILLRQNHLNKANDVLYKARVSMEGILGIRRLFPPHSIEFYRDLVEIYIDLAEIWLRKQDFKTCNKACKQAETYARKAYKELGDKSLMPLVYTILGKTLHEQGNHDRALQWYQMALQYAIDHKDQYSEERILSEMAEAYRGKGENDRARQYYDQAREIQEQLGDVAGLAVSFGGIGDLLVEEGKLAQAQHYCEQAYQYQQLVGDLDRFWRTCLSLVKIHLEKGQFDKALQYWSQARVFLFEQRVFDLLKSRKQREIYDLLRRFVDHYRTKGQWEECHNCLADLKLVAPFVCWDRKDRGYIQMTLGEACFKTKRWQQAIEAFTEALELADHPLQRAEIHEWLGDVYSLYEPPSRISPLDPSWKDEAQDQAERHYEEATKLLVRLGHVQRALAVYGKLLERVVSDEAGLLQLPFTFWRILQVIPLQQGVYERFVDKSVDVLLKHNLPSEAGDILVYTARGVAPISETNIPLKKKVSYLRRAETLYRRGNIEETILGFHNLIPTYYRLGLWEKVVYCFKELFQLNIQARNADEFIETYRALWIISDQIKITEMKRFVKKALEGPTQMGFSPDQKARLFLYTAKIYKGIADNSEDPDEKRYYEDLALEYYNKVLELAPEDAAITGTVLNDSALIFQDRKEYAEALQRLNESISISERYHDYKGMATSLHNRGCLYLETRHPDEALSDFELALKFKQRVVNYWNERLQHQDQQPLTPQEVVDLRFDKQSLAITSWTLARFLASRGNWERARDLAEQATQIYHEIGMPDDALRIQRALPLLFSCLLGATSDLSEEDHPSGTWQSPAGREIGIPGIGVQSGALLGIWPVEAGIVWGSGGPAETEPEVSTTCPNCGAIVGPDDWQCPNCGAGFFSCPRCGEMVDLERGICPNCGQAICPECGAAISDNDEVCPNCGTELVLSCPKCGAEVSAEDTVCPHCGEPFEI